MRHKEEVFHNEQGEALVGVAQGGGNIPSLEAFMARFYGALSNLVSWKVSLFIAGRVGKMTLKNPFKLKTIL